MAFWSISTEFSPLATIIFLNLFLAALGLPCCAGFSLVVESGGYSPAVVHRLLIVVTSRCGAQALGCVGFSSCGTWAYLLRGMWDLLRSEIEPMSPALAGRFFTTEPTLKPLSFIFALFNNFFHAKINNTKMLHIYVYLLWKKKHLNSHISIQL